MVDTFNFTVETKPQGSTNLRSRSAKFGEGYVQKAGDGINAKTTTWTVVVDNTEAVVGAVREFLDEHGGYIPFYWTPPGRAVAELFTCEMYSETPHLADQNRITATFERFHSP